MRGFCLWRIRVEVLIHPQVFHAGDFFFLRSWRTQHDAKITRCPCGGDHLGSAVGGRDRLGCVSNFPDVNAQPPEEGNTSYFWHFRAIFKGSHDGIVLSVCSTFTVCSLFVKSRCKLYYFICTRPAIHSFSLLQTSFIKPVETTLETARCPDTPHIGKGWVKMICF